MKPEVHNLLENESIYSVIRKKTKKNVLLDDANQTVYSQPSNEVLKKIFKLDNEDEISDILIITKISSFNFNGFNELIKRISMGELAIRKFCYYGLDQSKILWDSVLNSEYKAFSEKLLPIRIDDQKNSFDLNKQEKLFYELSFGSSF